MSKPNRTCTIPGCERPHNAHGLCRKHDARLRRHGDPLGGGSERDGRSKTPEYEAWHSMKQRCANPNDRNWSNYGSRGIQVWPGWLHDYPAFLTHLGPKPGPSWTLDRIDNDGNYEPGNVRWATRSQQEQNKRRRTHCKRGHPFDAANTYVRPNGDRVCRACRRAIDARRSR